MKLTNKLILGSNSPRRKEILSMAGFEFEVMAKPIDEDFDKNLPLNNIPTFLAKKKANCFKDLDENTVVLCADTVVISENKVLNKPLNYEEAVEMLKSLSGKTHEVITGVCIKTAKQKITFSDSSLVSFKELSLAEINYYIRVFQPMDKAGAYGIQDFIGMIGITKIEGSFYNVMGLPIHRVYEEMEKLGLIKIETE